MTIDLFEQLERHAALRPDGIALQTISGATARALTFRELIDRCRARSRLLRDRGVEPGDRVALLLPNDHEFGVAFLAAASAGAVIVPLDPSQDIARLCAAIEDAECRLLICSREGTFGEQARGISNRLPGLPVLDSHGGGSWETDTEWPLTVRDPDDDFLLMYTGGTTGAPKGVRLSLRGIMVTIRDTLEVFPLDAGDHVLSILPLFHIMAIQANLLGPLCAGARVSYLPARDPQAIVDAFREHRITAFLCVPMFYYQVHRRIFDEIARQGIAKRAVFAALFRLAGFLRGTFGWNAGRLFFRPVHRRFGFQLRGFGVGAARFAPEIAADLHNLGFAFFQGYGMTETSGLAAISAMSMKGGLSCGRPLKNIEIRIEAPDAQGRGEILLRGGNIMKGYWKDAEATRAALADGWLHTGDIGRLSGGELYVSGRKKEVIVLSSGKNIFPEPLETWFQTNCPLIQEICIFGHCANGAGAERLHAMVVPDALKFRELGIANIREELGYRIQNLNRNLPAHEKLSGFDIRFEPLPRTSSRKLQRFRIQEEFARSGRPVVADEPPLEAGVTESAGVALVREMIARIKPGRPIDRRMNLELDLSFDSLERVELLSNVQEAFGLQIAAEQAAGILTVGDVMALTERFEPLQATWAEWDDILKKPLSEAEREMADRYLGTRPVAAPIFFAAMKILRLVAKVLLRGDFPEARKWKIGAFIIAANHQSYLDFPLIAGSLPYAVFRRTFTLSTSRLVRGGFQSWFGRTVRAIPIDPDRNLRTALRLAAEGLRRGMVLCVFPEGHRSIDGELQHFRMGASIVAVESSAGVIPAGMTGTGNVWGRGGGGIRLAPVRLKFGTPIYPTPGESYASFNQRLLLAVEELIAGQ